MGFAKEKYTRQSGLGMISRPDKTVCAECFGDDDLKNVIVQNDEIAICSFCQRNGPSAPLDLVIEHIAQCVSFEYADAANILNWDGADGGYQGDTLDGHELLYEIDLEVNSDELFDEIAWSLGDVPWCTIEYMRTPHDQRLGLAWQRFKSAIMHLRRFKLNAEDDDDDSPSSDEIPLNRLLAAIAEEVRNAGLVKSVAAGLRTWRVRQHRESQTIKTASELSPPPVEKATQANRMSPAGVVMFYGAENFDTACRETVDRKRRAEKLLTGVEFETVRTLNILDLCDVPEIPGFFNLKMADQRRSLIFLNDFVDDLAKPIKRDGREHVDYVPTQAFTESVRYEMKTADGHPIEGIRYRSAKDGTPCYVLFCGQDECIGTKGTKQWMKMRPNSLKVVRTADVRPLRKPKGRS